LGKFADAIDQNRDIKVVPLSDRKDTISVKNDTRKLEDGEALLKPTRKHPIDRNLITLHAPQSYESEQFKHLRTNILFPITGTPPRSILITSTAPGEGKSFVAANLAVSIAQGIHEHVLLMDCDLRRPKQHHIFGYEGCIGLREHLTQQTPLPSLLLKTDVDKLTLLPAGTRPHNPSELLSSEQMFEFIREVRNRYQDRFVVIDSPPPQLTSESSAISRHVDGIILVVESGKTKKDLILNLIETLGKEKMIGTVFNRFDPRSTSYYGHYKNYKSYYG
jgi:protein-tyrosine kinase